MTKREREREREKVHFVKIDGAQRKELGKYCAVHMWLDELSMFVDFDSDVL